ncbi:uncharacterized protein RSE6_14228 [Rhynchosporium secalis]|uniref:Uncharacterized protein n=1 Tax=Rhynchosporium secalis TaxID=38038 RepID=A0A1E1MUS8_RHYSE|nr:uncharacterized protein RSE6_14228 [Rhynchosporium secalis]
MSSQSFAGKTVSRSSDSWATTKSSSVSYSNGLRFPMDTCSQPAIEILRCIRCAKCVKAIKRGSEFDTTDGLRVDDVNACGMVRFGHNLFYCIYCARMVGYNESYHKRTATRPEVSELQFSKKYEVLREPRGMGKVRENILESRDLNEGEL